MIKNMIITTLVTRILMEYMITPTPVDHAVCFGIWWVISFVVILMAEDAVDQAKGNLPEGGGEDERGTV